MMVNEGTWDRVIRGIIAVISAVLAFDHVGNIAGEWIFGIIAVIALLTAVTGFCPLYKVFGIRTCPVKQS